MFERIFLAHPRSVGEGYWEHQGRAMRIAADLMVAGAACAIHAVAPAFFQRTASSTIRRLHEDITSMRPSSASEARPAAAARRRAAR